MTIDNANLAAAGTTTREDFALNIATGAGDDTVYVDSSGKQVVVDVVAAVTTNRAS